VKVYETCKNCKRDCKVEGLGYLAFCPGFEPNSEKAREKYDRERFAFSIKLEDVMKRENRYGGYI
jgi:hypothetical protein